MLTNVYNHISHIFFPFINIAQLPHHCLHFDHHRLVLPILEFYVNKSHKCTFLFLATLPQNNVSEIHSCLCSVSAIFCMNMIQFFCFHVNKHLHCFSFVALTNKSAMHRQMHVISRIHVLISHQ